MSQSPIANNPLQARILAARGKRLRQVLHLLLLTLGSLLLLNLFMSGLVTQLVLLFSMILLTLAYWPLQRSNIGLAAAIIVFVMIVCLAAVMWLGSGLRSSAMLAYPGLLIFCVLMGERRLFIVSYLVLLAYMAALVAATHAGLRSGNEHHISWLVLLEFAVVITAITLVVHALAGDIFRLLERIESDRQSALESHRVERRLAMHDTLTGLPNRRQAPELFARLCQSSHPEGLAVAVAFIDLDGFKAVNDAHGHPVGDQALQAIASHLHGALRDGDALLRLGGDEFLLLLGRVATHHDVVERLDQLTEALPRPLPVAGRELQVSLTTGVALAWPRKAVKDISHYIELADRARYQGKREGRNQYRFHAEQRADHFTAAESRQ